MVVLSFSQYVCVEALLTQIKNLEIQLMLMLTSSYTILIDGEDIREGIHE